MPVARRRFQAILMLSVLLHGGVFWRTAASRSPRGVALPPLIATLRQAPIAPAVTAQNGQAAPAAAKPKEASVAPAADLSPKVRRASSHPVAVAAPLAIPPAGPANVSAPAASGVHEALAGASVEPALGPAATPAIHADATPPKASGDVLAGYRQRLAALLADVRDYPRLAAMRGWEGEVRLRLKIARQGALLGVVLDRSSGYDVLDRHALALLEGRGDFPPLPEALEANEIQVIVPISYKLRKTT